MRDETVARTGNNKPEGSVDGGIGGKLTLTAPFWARRKAERMLEKMCIGFDLSRGKVVIEESDQKRSGVNWSAGRGEKYFNLAGFSVRRRD